MLPCFSDGDFLTHYDLAIIGGGASGLVCAISAKRKNKNLRVAVFEAQQKIGKKILATGNGRCNLTNMNISAEKYHGSFDGSAVFEKYPPQRLIDFFSSLGLICTEENGGLVYPLCKQASAVLDTMRAELERLKVDILCDCAVSFIKKDKGSFLIKTSDKVFTSDKAVIATGGKASPSVGGTGAGLDLLRNLGHKIVTPFPCLCPIEVKSEYIKSLKGIRARGSASLFDGKRHIKSEQGEIQFAENALSGICVFNLTTVLENLSNPIIAINLMSDYSNKEITDILYKRKSIFANETLEQFFTGMFHKMIGLAILKSSKISDLSRKCKTLSDDEITRIARTIQSWKFECKKNQSFAKAQVMSGGVSGSEINPYTMESKKVKNLFICGEAVDICGDCGGFNLHFAFSSGLVAGENI